MLVSRTPLSCEHGCLCPGSVQLRYRPVDYHVSRAQGGGGDEHRRAGWLFAIRGAPSTCFLSPTY